MCKNSSDMEDLLVVALEVWGEKEFCWRMYIWCYILYLLFQSPPSIGFLVLFFRTMSAGWAPCYSHDFACVVCICLITQNYSRCKVFKLIIKIFPFVLHISFQFHGSDIYWNYFVNTSCSYVIHVTTTIQTRTFYLTGLSTVAVPDFIAFSSLL